MPSSPTISLLLGGGREGRKCREGVSKAAAVQRSGKEELNARKATGERALQALRTSRLSFVERLLLLHWGGKIRSLIFTKDLYALGDLLGTENAEVKIEVAPVPSCSRHSRRSRCEGTMIRKMQCPWVLRRHWAPWAS